MLEVKNLKITFFPKTVNEKVAINDISLTINDDDFITVIGSNGAGKSTLLNIISGSLTQDEGQVLINGNDVSKVHEHNRAKYIGRVFQDPRVGTCPDLTIEENLSLAKRRGKRRTLRKGITKKEREEYKELLASLNLGLETRLKTKVGLLSGGQRQAVTLLMATLVRPDILLLDEHTAALDPKTAALVLELTDKIVKKEKLTTFMVTHNMKDAIKYGNRLIMMANGKIVLDIKGKEKEELTVKDLLAKFESVAGDEVLNDSAILG